ncbi:MAG TPA: MerR family transcriptional regulator [Rhodobacteraceae bacterium]|nr:MerR family transcriptional regulator [Paracoccaceae bacterium]
MMSIGEISRKTGVKVPTIRYYEQMGLISAPERSEGNQRRYFSKELDRLAFIKHGRELGLKLEDIRELLALSAIPDQTCEEANRIADDHLQAVRRKITNLQKLETELSRIANGCKGHTIGECYVIEALSNHRLCDGGHT